MPSAVMRGQRGRRSAARTSSSASQEPPGHERAAAGSCLRSHQCLGDPPPVLTAVALAALELYPALEAAAQNAKRHSSVSAGAPPPPPPPPPLASRLRHQHPAGKRRCRSDCGSQFTALLVGGLDRSSLGHAAGAASLSRIENTKDVKGSAARPADACSPRPILRWRFVISMRYTRVELPEHVGNVDAH